MFEEIIQELRIKGNFTLSDVVYVSKSTRKHGRAQAQDIVLTHGLTKEWPTFLKYTSSAGIEISEAEDTVTWSKDENRCIPTTKVAYISLLEDEIVWVSKWWHKQVWKGNLPIKIKCFLWLALENKLLTQDNFQNGGGIIVYCYILCGATLETVDHLLVWCRGKFYYH